MLRIFRNRKSLASVFRHIYYKTDWWKAGETLSGPGSTLKNTVRLRNELPQLLQRFQIRSLLDAPCGDLNWISHTDLTGIEYTGVDIVKEVINVNREKFPGKNFLVADITMDKLPGADAVLCRDCFIHLPNAMILEAISNFRESGIRFLITNTYNFIKDNTDIKPGQFRMINLLLPPFSLPAPLAGIEEEYTSGYPDKQLAIWQL